MLNEIVTVRIIERKDLKVGDTVLFNRHKVIVKLISIDSWTFGNEDIGDLTMPLYNAYYKSVEDEEDYQLKLTWSYLLRPIMIASFIGSICLLIGKLFGLL